MKLAHISIRSGYGFEQWRGSLRDYFYMNDYKCSERRELCQRLREDSKRKRRTPELFHTLRVETNEKAA